MTTFRNTSDFALSIDRFGILALPGETFEIPDVDADSLDGSPFCEAVDGAPEIALPAEVVRDLEQQDAQLDGAGADVPSEPLDAPSVPSDAADVASDAVAAPADAVAAPVAEVPTLDRDQEDALEQGDLDSFTQA